MSPDKMVEEHEITVEYALTRGEVAGGLLRSVAQSPKYRGKILLYSVGIGVFTLLYRAALTRSVTPSDVMIAVGYGVGFLLVLPLWLFIRAKTAKRTLKVSRGGIWTEIGRIGKQYEWKQIREVTDARQFILIALTNGNAFFIPRRAFPGIEQREHFLTETRRWMQASG
jgi:YcxB-like protein